MSEVAKNPPSLAGANNTATAGQGRASQRPVQAGGSLQDAFAAGMQAGYFAKQYQDGQDPYPAGSEESHAWHRGLDSGWWLWRRDCAD